MEKPKLKVIKFTQSDVIATSTVPHSQAYHVRLLSDTADEYDSYPVMFMSYDESTGKWTDVMQSYFYANFLQGGIVNGAYYYRNGESGPYYLCKEEHTNTTN